MRFRTLVVASAVLAMPFLGTSSTAKEASYPHGFVQATCAPWDGPALEIRLTTEPVQCKASNGPFVLISIWRGLPLHAGQTVKFGPGEGAGTASRCAKANDCRPARSGTVVFERFEDGSLAAGRYELVFKDDDVLKGTFDVKWCASRPLCG
jgi:hypothetical protein